MEFYENTGGAMARLWWQSATVPFQAIPNANLRINENGMTAAPFPATYAEWLASGHSGTAQFQDSDDVPNLMEYALGTSDNGRNTSGIIPSRAIDNHIIVSVTRSLAADDVLCTFESSTDLVTWGQGFDLVSETPTGDGTVDVVMRSAEPMSGNFFIRLKVSRR
jgi:hypothetical protein